jgi:lysophospholipase L1-like esterase
MEAGEANSPATSYPPLATAPEAQVFVLGISPMARWWEGAREHNAVIREINTKLSEGANKNGYRFIELDSVLADENGFLSGEMTSDGVHLSAKGYVVVLGKMKDGPLSGWRGEKNSI